MVLARMIARIGMALAVARGLSLFFMASLHPALSALAGIGFFLAAIGRTAAEVARLYYIRQIALRIPDGKLAARANFLAWAYGISLGTYAILNAAVSFVMLTLKQRPDWFSAPYMLLQGTSWLGTIIFSIVYVFMLIRFGRAIQLQKMLARVMWGRPEP